jgi:hypothetical protein
MNINAPLVTKVGSMRLMRDGVAVYLLFRSRILLY